MNKKDTDKKLEDLKIFRKKIILWEADNEIQEAQFCVLKGWINALIKCLELFSVLFEFYPKSLMERKGKGINDNLSDLEKVIEDLRRRPKLRVKKGRAESRKKLARGSRNL
ncbi:hypothetical protein ES703_97771 [subsurface metagenome]